VPHEQRSECIFVAVLREALEQLPISQMLCLGFGQSADTPEEPVRLSIPHTAFSLGQRFYKPKCSHGRDWVWFFQNWRLCHHLIDAKLTAEK
jgi:hypothetical protein